MNPIDVRNQDRDLIDKSFGLKKTCHNHPIKGFCTSGLTRSTKE